MKIVCRLLTRLPRSPWDLSPTPVLDISRKYLERLDTVAGKTSAAKTVKLVFYLCCQSLFLVRLFAGFALSFREVKCFPSSSKSWVGLAIF